MSLRHTLVAAAMLLAAAAAHAEFTSAPVTTAHVGVPYRYDIVATGVGHVVISAPNPLPPWLALVQTGNGTATLSGTPSAGDSGAGIVIRASDSACQVFLLLCHRYQFFDITIVPNASPEVVPPGIEDQTATEATPFRLDFSAAFQDADGDALTYTVVGLPASLSAAGSVVSGTPTADEVAGSPYEIEVRASDGRGGAAVERFALTVAALARADLAIDTIKPAEQAGLTGESMDWSFLVVNHGPEPSGDAELEVIFDGQPVSLDAHACIEEAENERRRLVCPIAPLDPDGTATLVLGAAADAAGDVYVTAELHPRSDLPIDPAASNNRAAAALNIGTAVVREAAQRLDAAVLGAAVGDVDGDGFDDVLAATASDAPAALHLNLNDPTSLHASLLKAGDRRRGLSTLPLSLGEAGESTDAAFADFDGDGHLDAVVVGAPGLPAQLFMNDGTGVLAPAGTIGLADDDTRAVETGDLDGDGLADMLFVNAGVSTVYLNRGGVDFEASPIGVARETVGAALFDANGDGLVDLVLVHLDGDATLHLNTGAGFGSTRVLETGPTQAVAIGDFNGDGSADLVFARAVPGPRGVPANPIFINDGAGVFALALELGASPTIDVLVTDLAGDGALDIVAINATGVHQRFIGDGAGGFALDPVLLSVPGALRGAVGRIGQRPGKDLVIAGEEGITVLFNDGLGGLGLGDTRRPVIELMGTESVSVTIDDVYRDAGATVTDDIDDGLTASVDNPVDSKVIGTYTVTYTANDSAGNAAVPVTRTVRVEAREAQGGGGGGVFNLLGMALLGLIAAARSSLLRGKVVSTRNVARRDGAAF